MTAQLVMFRSSKLRTQYFASLSIKLFV